VKFLTTIFLALACCTQQSSITDAGPDSAPPEIKVDAPEAAPPVIEDAGFWSLHFSPNGGCEHAVADFIQTAHVSVHLMAYGFTSEKIANALIAVKANSQGKVDVQVVLDKSDKTAKGSMAYMLKSGNVPVWIDSKHAIMHDKFIVVDGKAFENGSFNYTNAAEHSNAENCLIEGDERKARAFDDNWALHKGHSDLLQDQ